jgi:hypothetical protein
MTRLTEAEVVLPNGYWRAGSCFREACVHSIPEGDEELGAELSAATLAIERASTLLARCVSRLGESDCSGTDAIRQLSLGDREALLLHIQRITFGEQLECVLRCPACAEPMEFQLRVDELLLPVSERRQQRYEETLATDGTTFRVRFRIPTAKDVETAIGGAPVVLEAAARAVLLDCVEWIRPDREPGEGILAVEVWPADLVAQIAARIAELDPQAEIWLQLTCPACGQKFPTSLDTTDYILRELAARERRNYEQVHQLALAYHWSEADILRMTPRKRRAYLEILSGGSQ